MPFSKILRVLYDRATRILESKKKQRTEYAESVTTVQTLILSINGMTTRKEKLKTEHKKYLANLKSSATNGRFLFLYTIRKKNTYFYTFFFKKICSIQKFIVILLRILKKKSKRNRK